MNVSTFFKDLRYAVRMLAKSPGFAAAAIICLALGIGGTSAIFSVVHAVLLRPLGYRDPGRLVRLYTEFLKFPNGGLRRFWASPPEYDDMKKDLTSWESLDAWASGGVNLAGAADPIRVTSTYVTGGLFSTLGVSPEVGRAITPQDDTPGLPLAAVISHDLWQRVFAGDRSAVGRVIQVNGRNANLVGVMPPTFSFPPGELDPPDIWLPLQLGPPKNSDRGSHGLFLVGRLKDGVSLSVAEGEIARFVEQSTARLGAANDPFTRDNHTLVAYGLQNEVVRTIRPALWTLMGAVAFVLLISCVNVANLLLARAEARQREIGIRKALGAGIGQLIRQFTIEGLLLSLSGAALGLLLAMAGLKMMIAAGKASIPRADEVTVDPTVLAVTIVVSILTALFFGLAPLAQITGGTLHDALKANAGRGAAGSVASSRFRSILVSSELALALVLLIGTGLMIRAFWKLTEVNPGFRPESLLTLRVNLPGVVYPTTANQSRFWHAVEERLAAIPGVTSASAMYGLPPERPINANDTDIENFTPVPGGPGKNIDYYQSAGDHFFETMGIRLVDGRLFDARDVAGAPTTVIVNQTMARTYYGNASAVGRRIRPNFADPWCTIVGVVEDVKNAGLDKPAGTELFLPERQNNASGQVYFAVRTAGDPHSLISAVRSAIRDVDPSLPLAQVRTMDEVLAGARSRPRFLTTLLGLFSATALLLAAVGLYGVISYSVTRRMTEFGIRMAMGAKASDVLGLVLSQGLKLAAAGVLAGALGALVLTRLISGLLFEVSSFDPLTFCAMAILLGAVTVAACIIPARRATRVDPLIALRYE